MKPIVMVGTACGKGGLEEWYHCTSFSGTDCGHFLMSQTFTEVIASLAQGR